MLVVVDGAEQWLLERWPVARRSPADADKEGWALVSAVCEHSKAVARLALADVSLTSSAFSVARAGLEAMSWARWLLKPSDPLEREARYCARLARAVRDLHNVQTSNEPDLAVEDPHEEAALESELKALKRRLVEAGRQPSKLPNTWDLFSTNEQREIYPLYQVASAHVHATVLLLEREDPDDRRPSREARDPEWVIPLGGSWLALQESAAALIPRIGHSVRNDRETGAAAGRFTHAVARPRT